MKNWKTLTVTTALLATLFGCGGGGGSTTPVTPPADTTKPVLIANVTSPFPTTGTFSITSNEAINGSGIVISVKNGATDVAGTSVFGPDGKSETWKAVSALTGGTAYSVLATATDLAGNVGTVGFTLTPATAATSATAAFWPPAIVLAEGVTGVQVLQLPAGCTSEVQQCWEDSITSGTTAFVATSAKMTGVNTRVINFAVFENAAGLYNYLAVYADDGSLVGSDISGGQASAFDKYKGTPSGIVIHLTGTTDCVERYWQQASSTWANRAVTCPAF